MPVEVESSGQVSEFMRVLRRRSALILVPFALLSSLGVCFAVIVPKKFVAQTRVMVHDVLGSRSSSAEGREQGKIATHLIRSPRRIQAIIIQDVGWPFQSLSDGEKEDLVTRVLGNLTVETPNMGLGVKQQVVKISYADTDRSRAFEFLSAVSERWRSEVLDATRNAKEVEFNNLSKRKGQMEATEIALGNEIAELLRINSIPPWNPDSRGERPLDPAFARLDEVKLELVELDLTLEGRVVQLADLQLAYDEMPEEIPAPETRAGLDLSGEILKNQEKIVELRLEVSRGGYKPAHGKYIAIQNEIREREQVIRLLEDSARAGIAPAGQLIPNVQKLNKANAIAEAQGFVEKLVRRKELLETDRDNLTARTQELQSVYQRLESLMGERVRVHSNLIAVGEDFNTMRRENDILMSAAGNPFTILDEPKMPVRPTQPDPVLITVASILFSLVLGFGMALITEYSRSCFRSVNEVTRVMVVPVLGTVNGIVTRPDRRKLLLGRFLVGGSTIAFVGAIGFMTWAWTARPDLLTDDLRLSIDAFRASFE